jgi:hypothetical protein
LSKLPTDYTGAVCGFAACYAERLRLSLEFLQFGVCSRKPLPSPPWGRGWLDEALSSAEARRVRGSKPNRLIPPPALATHSSPRCGAFRLGRHSAKLACFVNLCRRAFQGARLAIGFWRFHRFDPLTRPAPAGESAGCGPPSPPRGRGLRPLYSTVSLLSSFISSFHHSFHHKCTNSRERRSLSA